MALTITLLAAKNVTSTTAEIVYNEMPVSPDALPLRSTQVKNIFLVNNGSAAHVLDVYVVPANDADATSAKRRIAPKSLTIPVGSQVVLKDEITLSRQIFTVSQVEEVHGDMIVVQVSAPTSGVSLNCVINGVERDV